MPTPPSSVCSRLFILLVLLWIMLLVLLVRSVDKARKQRRVARREQVLAKGKQLDALGLTNGTPSNIRRLGCQPGMCCVVNA